MCLFDYFPERKEKIKNCKKDRKPIVTYNYFIATRLLVNVYL